MQALDCLVLGGGWAGLLYGYKLKKKTNKLSIAVVDQRDRKSIGGLLRSETVSGFTFDIAGPHLLFSRDNKTLAEMLSILDRNVVSLKRNNFVLFNGKYVPYPFENGIYVLEPENRVKFARSIVEKMIHLAENPKWRPQNFLEFINGFFGKDIADEYLIPYNKKIWKRPLDAMAADWVFRPGRLPFPEIGDILKSVAGIPSTGYKEQAQFYYPEHGGIFSMYQQLLKKAQNEGVNLFTGEKVKNIEITHGEIQINQKFKAKKVVSTIPIPELILAIDNSNEIKKLADKFDYNSVVIVGVALKSEPKKQTTIYVPDPSVVFHRYTYMNQLSKPMNENQSNLIAEITVPKGEKVVLEDLVKRTIEDLLRVGAIADEEDILFSKGWFNQYGYPIYNMDHNEIRSRAMSIVDQLGINSVGRWGSWHYWNTDMVLKAVNELVDNTVGDSNVIYKL